MSTLNMKDINERVYDAAVDQFREFLFSPRCFWSEGIFLSLASLMTVGVGDPLIMGTLTGVSGVSTFSTLTKQFVKTQRFINDYKKQLIMETDEFIACKESYENMILKIAEFLKYVGCNDTIGIGLMFKELLDSGLLSINGNFSYHKFDRDEDIFPELWGARVSTGSGVCRHISSCLVDVYKELGVVASYMSVKGCNGDAKSILADFILPRRPTHAVVMVGDNYGKYLIDPTWNTVAQIHENDKFASVVWGSRTVPMYHINYNEFLYRNKKIDYQEYVELRNMQAAKLRRSYIVDLFRNVTGFLRANPELLNEFRDYISPEVSEVAYLEKRISCYRDYVVKDATPKKLGKKRT